MNEIKEREEYPLNEEKTAEEVQNAQPDTKLRRRRRNPFRKSLENCIPRQKSACFFE